MKSSGDRQRFISLDLCVYISKEAKTLSYLVCCAKGYKNLGTREDAYILRTKISLPLSRGEQGSCPAPI